MTDYRNSSPTAKALAVLTCIATLVFVSLVLIFTYAFSYRPTEQDSLETHPPITSTPAPEKPLTSSL